MPTLRSARFLPIADIPQFHIEHSPSLSAPDALARSIRATQFGRRHPHHSDMIGHSRDIYSLRGSEPEA